MHFAGFPPEEDDVSDREVIDVPILRSTKFSLLANTANSSTSLLSATYGLTSIDGNFISDIPSKIRDAKETLNNIKLEVDSTRPGAEEMILHIALAANDFNPDKKTLFATKLWPISKTLGQYFVLGDLVKNQTVIEFGCGAAVPSICAVLGDAKFVCTTDYPSPAVIDNVWYNCRENLSPEQLNRIHVVGYKWGDDVSSLLSLLRSYNEEEFPKYDVVIASECIWKPDSHFILLQSIAAVIKSNGFVYITYTNHIPALEQEYKSFFDLAETKFNLVRVYDCSVTVKHMWNDGEVESYIVILQSK